MPSSGDLSTPTPNCYRCSSPSSRSSPGVASWRRTSSCICSTRRAHSVVGRLPPQGWGVRGRNDVPTVMAPAPVRPTSDQLRISQQSQAHIWQEPHSPPAPPPTWALLLPGGSGQKAPVQGLRQVIWLVPCLGEPQDWLVAEAGRRVVQSPLPYAHTIRTCGTAHRSRSDRSSSWHLSPARTPTSEWIASHPVS